MFGRLAALLLAVTTSAVAAEPCVELNVGAEKYRGRVFAKDSRRCWLTAADGSINTVTLDEVTAFRKSPSDFRPISTSVLGDQLARKFGRKYEVAKARDYVVVGPRGRARDYAALFDRTARTFQLYFRVRGFDVPSPEFPLIAIVYATRGEFEEHCRDVGANPTGFAGFYLGNSNRIVMYETDRATATRRGRAVSALPIRIDEATSDLAELPPVIVGSVGSQTESLLIHEATHQLAYNCGLHVRLGWNPKWTVEGLATVFEAPGIRHRSSSRSRDDRVNPRRLRDFRDYAASRRKEGAILELIESDRRLETAVSDFYAESWALTFFLVETRPREYARYMQGIADREPFRRYRSEQRVADFKAAFGDNLVMLDAEFVRFMEKLD